MTYDLETIREAVAEATPGEWESYSEPDVGMPATLMAVTRADGAVFPSRNPIEPLTPNDIWAISVLMNAARAGLLEDAAIGRAVRAAAERDGLERKAMARGLADLEDVPVNTLYLLHAQAAAQAIIDFVKEKAEKGENNVS